MMTVVVDVTVTAIVMNAVADVIMIVTVIAIIVENGKFLSMSAFLHSTRFFIYGFSELFIDDI
ncbi:conserved hypothetical protein [Bacillus mycoides]|uniref:Uncharacterized protein n=1 Tax=Bacillus mycoides TaxID=1405 RepID=A0A654B1R8_BACMY|nr:conserved hypothetical protein [Bacillus mycoides]